MFNNSLSIAVKRVQRGSKNTHEKNLSKTVLKKTISKKIL